MGLLNPGGPLAQFKRNRCSISPVELILQSGVRIFFQYGSFNNLFIDWLYVFECRESGVVDIRKFHADRVFAKNRPQIVIKPEEQDHVIIQRDGQCYIRLCTDPEKGLSIISKTGYADLENIESPPKTDLRSHPNEGETLCHI